MLILLVLIHFLSLFSKINFKNTNFRIHVNLDEKNTFNKMILIDYHIKLSFFFILQILLVKLHLNKRITDVIYKHIHIYKQKLIHKTVTS